MVLFEDLKDKKKPIAVVGLGYVGLPLAIALARKYDVVGFDINTKRIEELVDGIDSTGEVSSTDMESTSVRFTDQPQELSQAVVIVVAVPTPIDSHRNPDLAPVLSASRTVGRFMAKGSVVVYESTVYPGVTEDECVPILEKESGMAFGSGFTVGYSPERINPGDKVHRLETIKKVVSGSDDATTSLLASLYGSVVTAGIHEAPSIKVAEAAKVIENTQRDINIALMNELALIFDKLNIDTKEVLEAAGTKWNFLPFTPGLVGGHCIGVDPYYLTFKAEEVGHHPEIILAGRRINDNMGKYVAETCVKQLISQGSRIKGARVGVLGITFKENVPDLRNTKVVDILSELRAYGVFPLVYDPVASPSEALHEYGEELVSLADLVKLDAIILAVPHDVFNQVELQNIPERFNNPQQVVMLDIKGYWDKDFAVEMGYNYWRL